MVTSGSIPLSDSVDWGTYLARHDLVWDRLPHRWENGVFLGNGLLGTLMHVDLQLNRVRWWICRSDVGRIREREELIGVVNRRVIGSMDLVAVGEFGDPGGDARLGLWDAGAAGSVKTQRGNIGWCCFVPEKPNVVILELDWTSRWPESGYHVDPTFQEPGERSCSGDIRLYTVPDVDDVHGGGYTVVWRDTDLGDGKRLVVFSVGSSPSCRKMWKADDDGRSATDEALEALQAVDAGGLAAIRQSHQARWHDHYRRSFVSFANTELESHYWIQLYKHRSAARPEGPMIDNHGPWTTESRYGFSTWDMNVQAINRLHLPSNHAELGQPLMRFMDVNFTHERMLHGPSGELRAGVTHSAFLYLEDLQKETKETPAGTASCDSACKFLWACHNLWLQYRFTMDQALLVPLGDRLEGGINTFVAYCVPGDDGKLHVDDGYSWEACRGVPDPTCYIAVVEWAIQCRMKIDRLLGRDLDARWPELLDRLPPYPQGPEGYYLAVDHPPMPHRHWSHLMQIWPFHTVNWEQPQNREMIQKSVDHWVDLSAGPKAELPCAGFAVAAAIQLYAHMGQAEPIPELAEIYLHEWSKRGAMCWASTLYREMGPVIESPLLFADALLATMLQSWNGVIRVFPAWPDAWGDVVFHGLRAEGGFSVSAAREDGRVAWVAITSEVSTVSCSGKRSSSTVPSSGERSSSTVPSSGERSSSTVPSSGERSSSTVRLACGHGGGPPLSKGTSVLTRTKPEPCRLRVDLTEYEVHGIPKQAVVRESDDTLAIELETGASMLLTAPGVQTPIDIQSITPQEQLCNTFGLNERFLAARVGKERPERLAVRGRGVTPW